MKTTTASRVVQQMADYRAPSLKDTEQWLKVYKYTVCITNILTFVPLPDAEVI